MNFEKQYRPTKHGGVETTSLTREIEPKVHTPFKVGLNDQIQLSY